MLRLLFGKFSRRHLGYSFADPKRNNPVGFKRLGCDAIRGRERPGEEVQA